MLRPAGRSPIPFTVIGGFLGAGKTTLLNRVLREAGGTRYAVLVNDFGSLDIDTDLVAEHDGETIALANGCICCSIGDSLIDTLLALLARPDPADHILVEASGVADPTRIADIAIIDPALALDGIVVLADAAGVRAQARDRYVAETVLRQLAAADILVVNKIDLVDDAALKELDRWLEEVAPGVARVAARQADLPAALILGQSADAPTREPTDHTHDDGFRRASLQFDHALDRAKFERALDALPPTVLRAKGFLKFTDDPDRPWLLQRVGWRSQLTPAETEAGGGRLVFIGTPEMPDETELAARLRVLSKPD